jgi:hypothetical protein
MGTLRYTDERISTNDVPSVSAKSFLTFLCSFYILMSSITRNDFVEIMEMLDKRLNDKGKNWRHVFKVLSLKILIKQNITKGLTSH